MTPAPVYGVLGALAALPHRLAAREAERCGARLRRGVARGVTHVVFGRRLLDRLPGPAIAARVEAERAAGRALLSENGLLRRLGLAAAAGAEGVLPGAALAAQSGFAARDLDLLALFDAFERDAEPFSFRDLILARKYAGLVAGGAGWADIARSVHRVGAAASLTARALAVGGGRAIYARHADGLSELDGQLLLGLDEPAEAADDLFAEAEAAEAAGRPAEAAEIYGRCLALDPGDATAAFNRANCLRACGAVGEAERDYARALRADPRLAEAWFNLAGLLAGEGRAAAARRLLARAIAVAPDYADAVYELARLDFEAGELAAAERRWRRYLELDPDSDWARNAARGLRLAAMRAAEEGG